MSSRASKHQASADRPLDPTLLMTEKAFQNHVLNAAKEQGWLCYFTWKSLHSPKGYPDLTMLHPEHGWLIFAELKFRSS